MSWNLFLISPFSLPPFFWGRTIPIWTAERERHENIFTIIANTMTGIYLENKFRPYLSNVVPLFQNEVIIQNLSYENEFDLNEIFFELESRTHFHIKWLCKKICIWHRDTHKGNLKMAYSKVFYNLSAVVRKCVTMSWVHEGPLYFKNSQRSAGHQA